VTTNHVRVIVGCNALFDSWSPSLKRRWLDASNLYSGLSADSEAITRSCNYTSYSDSLAG